MAAEAERFFLAAHWADLHSGHSLTDERCRRATRVLPGQERSRQVGADGTPPVAEFAAMEFGALLEMGHVAAGCLMRDALNVRHRHPLLWAAIGAGSARVWQARKVAQMCAAAGLSEDQAHWVDAQTTGYAASLPWSRFETLVAAKIVEVDPAAAEERRKTAAMARFVRTGQSSEYGLKTLVARASAGDVIFFVAMVDRIAQTSPSRATSTRSRCGGPRRSGSWPTPPAPWGCSSTPPRPTTPGPGPRRTPTIPPRFSPVRDLPRHRPDD